MQHKSLTKRTALIVYVGSRTYLACNFHRCSLESDWKGFNHIKYEHFGENHTLIKLPVSGERIWRWLDPILPSTSYPPSTSMPLIMLDYHRLHRPRLERICDYILGNSTFVEYVRDQVINISFYVTDPQIHTLCTPLMQNFSVAILESFGYGCYLALAHHLDIPVVTYYPFPR